MDEGRAWRSLLPSGTILTLALLSGRAGAQEPPAFALPLTEQANWQVLQYRNLPPHRLRFSSAGLEMAVAGSTMPVIYPLPKTPRVTGVRFQGRVEGTLRVPAARAANNVRLTANRLPARSAARSARRRR